MTDRTIGTPLPLGYPAELSFNLDLALLLHTHFILLLPF